MTTFTIHGHRHASKLAIVAIGATCIAVATTGTAFAFLSSSGSGSDSSTGSSGLHVFRTNAVTASGTLLYPGGNAPLTLNVDNTGNNYALTVTSVALDTSRSIAIDGASGTCSNPAISVSTPAGWTGISVAADSTSRPTTIPNAVSMGLDADNGCQGASFTIPVTLTGHN